MTAVRATHQGERLRRVGIVVAAAASVAIALTGCGAGQHSQTASQVAAVNGNSADVGAVALRDVRVLYPHEGDYTNKKGGKAAVAFSAINNSEENADKITKITTSVGSVTITPAGAEIKPQKTLVAAGPDATTDESAKPAEAAAADPNQTPILVEITGLNEDLGPGLTIPVTFDFEKAGSVEIQVPIDAGTELPRQAATHDSAEGGH